MALYMSPRYVISYALSIVCAQQLKAAYDADPADGWARYHALCASRRSGKAGPGPLPPALGLKKTARNRRLRNFQPRLVDSCNLFRYADAINIKGGILYDPV